MDPENQNSIKNEINNLQTKITDQGAKIEAIYQSVEKTRKYFTWIFWITIVAVVLPILGLVFAIPNFISTYSNLTNIN